MTGGYVSCCEPRHRLESFQMLQRIRRVRGRFLASFIAGVAGALLWHLFFPDAAYLGVEDARFWIHAGEEVLLTAGIAGAAFLVIGAIARYRSALSLKHRDSA